MKFEKLNISNIYGYIDYLNKAIEIEPDLMTVDEIKKEDIINRIQDDFYNKSTSILAIDNEKVVGRIEFHYYGCIQDGYKMAYVNWIYVLPKYRHMGIASKLFNEFEKDCKLNGINEYFLIRALNENATKFYSNFKNATLSDTPILRKEID